MSITVYFSGGPELRMPKQPKESGDSQDPGIRFEGPVMTGEMSIREKFEREKLELVKRDEPLLPDLGPDIKAMAPPVAGVPNQADRLVTMDPVRAARLFWGVNLRQPPQKPSEGPGRGSPPR